MKPISFWHRLLDLISPRLCVVCDRRLSVTEDILCARCQVHLPRTAFHLSPTDNEMARLFWGQIPIERAAALFYYEAHAETARLLYALKYGDHPEIGEVMGRLLAREFSPAGFFDGIDEIVPVPLAPKRLRQRGYNQSLCLARGITAVTTLPVNTRAVRRTVFEESQTHKHRWARAENVEHAFALGDGEAVRGHHLLIVDDVVTTGATVIACARELLRVPGVKVSVLALGFAKTS